MSILKAKPESCKACEICDRPEGMADPVRCRWLDPEHAAYYCGPEGRKDLLYVAPAADPIELAVESHPDIVAAQAAMEAAEIAYSVANNALRDAINAPPRGGDRASAGRAHYAAVEEAKRALGKVAGPLGRARVHYHTTHATLTRQLRVAAMPIRTEEFDDDDCYRN